MHVVKVDTRGGIDAGGKGAVRRGAARTCEVSTVAVNKCAVQTCTVCTAHKQMRWDSGIASPEQKSVLLSIVSIRNCWRFRFGS